MFNVCIHDTLNHFTTVHTNIMGNKPSEISFALIGINNNKAATVEFNFLIDT